MFLQVGYISLENFLTHHEVHIQGGQKSRPKPLPNDQKIVLNRLIALKLADEIKFFRQIKV